MGGKALVRCGSCGTLNRLPAEKAGLPARCGECGAGLPVKGEGDSSVPVNVTDLSFEAEVLRRAGPVLLEFWSPSCGHCLRMEPVMEELARDFSGRLNVAKLDVFANPGTASRYEIRGTPAFVLIKDGREQARLAGALPKEELVRWLRKYI